MLLNLRRATGRTGFGPGAAGSAAAPNGAAALPEPRVALRAAPTRVVEAVRALALASGLLTLALPGASGASAAPAVLAVAAAPAAKAQAVAPAAPAAAAAAAAPAPSGPRVVVVQGAACSRVELAPVVQIPVGKSTVIRPPMPVARILMGNPDGGSHAARPQELPADGKAGPGAAGGAAAQPRTNALRPNVADVDVLLLSPNEVYLLGKTIGSTNIVMIDREQRCTAFDVVVGMDTSALQAALQTLLPEERGIRVQAVFDSVVLEGSVTDPEALVRVTDLAHAFVRGQGDGSAGKNPRIINMLQIDAQQQVMLEVKVAEVSKALLDSFGIDFTRAYVPGDSSFMRFLSGVFGGGTGVMGQISGTGPKNVPLSSVGTAIGGTLSGSGGTANAGTQVQSANVTLTYDQNGRPVYTTSYGPVPGRGVSNLTLGMQKNDGLVKVLAEPTVMAISGQTGSFLAGGKIFIPVSQSAEGGGRTVTLEEKEFGVSVKFTPTVLGGGRIHLKVRPEVSELNPAGVTITGPGGTAILPSFTSRKAETVVQLMDGQSFAIGGLIKNNTTTNVRAFPFLGELPVLGALFRSTEFQTDRAELVFVITPRLVKPLPPDYRLPTDGYVAPTRRELILEGRMEGRGSQVLGDGRPAAAADAPASKPAAPSPAEGGFDSPTGAPR